MANEDWAKDTKTRPEVLAMLSTSPSEEVRKLVAQNPTTPNTALMHLARDESDAVRKAITLRSNVPSDVLRIAMLSRESLAERDAQEAAAKAEAEALEAAEAQAVREATYEQHYPQPQPMPEPVTPKKPSIFAWFWRLFGRNN